jgi:hypothetical protein
MRAEEARFVGALIRDRADRIGVVLEIGSSDRFHREQAQPHIHQLVHSPLLAAGIRVITSDMKSGDGIDIVGDLFDPVVRDELAELHPDLVLCCNILEHVRDPQGLSAIVASLVGPDKWLLVTAPHSYPYHLDPIDTMFRPTPQEIARLFPDFDLEVGWIFEAGSFRGDMERHQSPPIVNFLRTLARSVWPWQGLEAAKARWHRWFWYFKPYEMSLALLRRPAG